VVIFGTGQGVLALSFAPAVSSIPSIPEIPSSIKTFSDDVHLYVGHKKCNTFEIISQCLCQPPPRIRHHEPSACLPLVASCTPAGSYAVGGIFLAGDMCAQLHT
jgi:hypothetical protein